MGIKAYLAGLRDDQQRRSLTYSLLDGAMWAVMFGFAENYIAPFVLFFGASIFQVSVLQGLNQLAIGAGQLSGGALVQVRGLSRMRISLWSVAGQALTWIFVYFGTLASGNPLVAIAFFCLGIYLGNLSTPAWNSWLNDLVPTKERGVFWAARNRALGVVQFLAICAAGVALYLGKLWGGERLVWGALFCMAALSRFGCILFLSRQHEPPYERTRRGDELSFLRFLRGLPTEPFGRFVVFAVCVNATVFMLNPIIQVYLLKGLQMNYLQYTVVTMVATIASFLFMTYWGPLSDRFGNRRILLVTSVALPFIAFAWVLLRGLPLLVLLQLLNGFFTAGLNLAVTNYIFDAIERDRLPKTFAYFNTLYTGAGFLGALASGAFSNWLFLQGWSWGVLDHFTTVFLAIGVLRLVVVLAFARRILEVRDTEPSPGLLYFYIDEPFQGITGVLFRRGRPRG